MIGVRCSLLSLRQFGSFDRVCGGRILTIQFFVQILHAKIDKVGRASRDRIGDIDRMSDAVTLELHLEQWAEDDPRRVDIAVTLVALANGCRDIGGRIRKGALPGGFNGAHTVVALGQTNFETDYEAHSLLFEGLQGAPVAAMASRLYDAPVRIRQDANLLVGVSPLDASASIDTNAAMGTVFSLLRRPDDGGETVGPESYLQCGTTQLAAGFAVYGPRTNLVITYGDGTHVFTLEHESGQFFLSDLNVTVPPTVREYAINAANYRHWNEAIRIYVDDCLKGSEGLRALDFNMRWIGSPVAEIYRIFKRGGIYLYPADTREGQASGRFWRIFEANPIAFIVEQAGGAASTGSLRLLAAQPADLHERIPLIVGSKAEVEYVMRLHSDPYAHGERSPLFGRRGLFRQ